MQNELQWWGEQKLTATQENDLVYVKECEKNIQKLTDQNIKNIEEVISVKEKEISQI